jgi:hypothetical protein
MRAVAFMVAMFNAEVFCLCRRINWPFRMVFNVLRVMQRCQNPLTLPIMPAGDSGHYPLLITVRLFLVKRASVCCSGFLLLFASYRLLYEE